MSRRKERNNALLTILLFLVSALFPALAAPASFEPGGHGDAGGNYRILLAGDSLMESLGPQFRDALSGYEGLQFRPIGKKSTGLCRPDFYNWPVVLEKNLQEFRPHVVIMWVGTNDNQGIHGMSGLGPCGSPAWQKAYYGKVVEIIKLCDKYGARLMFVSPPVMKEADFDAELVCITRIIEYACKVYKLMFLNAHPLLADGNGKYLQSGTLKDGRTVTLRTPDTVHITGDGNQIFIKALAPRLYWMLYRKMPKNTAEAGGKQLQQRAATSAARRGTGGINGGSTRMLVPTGRKR